MARPAFATPLMGNRIKFHFNPDKAVEVILYIANRVNEPGFHRISKILYFADRDHLANYGRFICGDSYIAMKHGPVPSGTYDILKSVRGNGLPCATKSATDSFRVENVKDVVTFRDYNLELMSDSEKTCLDAAISKYGSMSFGELTQLSHDKAWKSADENDLIDVEQIAATLPDATNILEYLANPYPD